VLEDELLAMLPLAPVHLRPEDCTGFRMDGPGRESGQTARPFADLQRLMSGGAGTDTK